MGGIVSSQVAERTDDGLTATFPREAATEVFYNTSPRELAAWAAARLRPQRMQVYRDALELTGLPSVEVHLSDIESREEWRRRSVIGELCVARVSGRGVEGYRDALKQLKAALQG